MGIAIGSLCLLVAGGAAFFCWLKKHAKSSIDVKGGEKVKQSTEHSQSTFAVPLRLVLEGTISIPSVDEFNKLLKFEDSLCQRFTVSQGKRYNNTGVFNLVPTNLPFDHNRIKLNTPVETCDYVNANWISNACEDSTYDELIYASYLSYKNIKFAIGQTPIPSTMQHHYRMILENQFGMMVGFGDISTPSDFEIGKKYVFGEVSLKVRSRTQMTKRLLKSEITITDTISPGVQYIHHTVCFDLQSLPNDGLEDLEYAKNLASSICQIRNEIKSRNPGFKVFAYDGRGGVKDASTFIVLYDLLQQVDEGLIDGNKVKTSAPDLNIFNAVNRLRKDRANAIEDISAYRNLFHCLNYYGPNHKQIQHNVSKKKVYPAGRHGTTQVKNELSTSSATSINDITEIEYEVDDSSSEESNVFADYCEDQIPKSRTYVNIEEMSEYI